MAMFGKKREAGSAKAVSEVRFSSHARLVPVVSEKAERLRQQGQYVFLARGGVTKVEAKKAVEAAFGVHVAGVNSTVLPRKTVRRGRSAGTTRIRHRFVIRLRAGESIDVTKAI